MMGQDSFVDCHVHGSMLDARIQETVWLMH
jgi:hypothetical protein